VTTLLTICQLITPIIYDHCHHFVTLHLTPQGEEYEFIQIDLTSKGQKDPKFLALQPFGKVPVLENTSNGFIIYESLAILRYLTVSAGGRWVVLKVVVLFSSVSADDAEGSLLYRDNNTCFLILWNDPVSPAPPLL